MNTAILWWCELAEHWLVAMGRASLYGGFVLAMVWAVCRCFPQMPSRWRCWLWRLAILKFLMCLVVANTWELPLLPSSWGGSWPALSSVSRPQLEPADVALPDSASPDVSRGSSAVTSRIPALDTISHAPASTAVTVSAGEIVLLVVLGSWAAIVLGLLSLMAGRIVAARAWRRQCVLLKDPEILSLGEQLARQFGLVQPPLLLKSDTCRSPVVLGAVRTAIVLPNALAQKSTPAEMRLILAHEMAHIRRGDLLGNWYVSIVLWLFFFHPLVWLAFRETRLAQESACDELALGLSGGSVVDYGNLIVDLAARCCRPASALVAVGVVESFHHSLARRLRAMKNFGTESLRMVVLCWFLTAAALVGLLPWRVVAQTAPPDDVTAAETDGQETAQDGQADADQFKPVQAAAGQYQVSVERVRTADGAITMGPSGFPMIPDDVWQDSRSGGSGGATWSATGGGMGGGFAGAYTKPNLILDVKVKPAKPGKANGTYLLCEVNGEVKAVDDQGNEFDSPGNPAAFRTRFADMDYPEGSGCTAIHLHRPAGASQYIRSLEGELYVIEAERHQVQFKGKELSRKTSKHDGDVTVELQKVKKTDNGIDVTLAASPPPLKNANDPFARMQQLMSSQNRMQVTLEDTEGKSYQPAQSESSSGGGRTWTSGGGSGGSSGGSGGSVWGSSSSSGGASWGSSSGSGGSSRSRGGRSSGKSSSSHGGTSQIPFNGTMVFSDDGKSGGDTAATPAARTFHFDPLPAGAELKAIHCTITDHTGKPQAVPFRLEGIRLP